MSEGLTMRFLRSRRVCRSVDDGFSLVETVIAMTIAGVIFSTLAFALVGGVHASVLSQQNQQAGDVLNQAVEQARALKYDQLTMQASDLATGEAGRSPALAVGGDYNPNTDLASNTAAAGFEPLVTDTIGGLGAHVMTVTQNNGSYKLRRYVTQPADAAAAEYKRLTVLVSWSALGKSHTRTYTTLIAPTKRGLPLPDFKLTAQSNLSQCRNPGSVVVYAFNVQNNGARDAWSISASPADSWAFYLDTNHNGSYDDD